MEKKASLVHKIKDYPKKFELILSLFRLFHYIRPYFKQLIIIHILGFVLLALKLSIPFSLKYIMASLQKENLSILIWVPPLVFVLIILLSGVSGIKNLVSTFISLKIGFSLQKQLYNKYLALDILYHFGVALGEKMSRITFDTQYLVQGVMILFSDILYLPLTIGVYISIMFFFDWKLTAVSILAIPPVILFSAIIGKRIKSTSTAIQEENVRVSRHLIDTLGGIITVKAFGRERKEQDRFAEVLKAYLYHGIQDALWRSMLAPSAKIVNAFFFCLIALFAFYRITSFQDLTLSNFIAFSSIVALFQNEIQKINAGIEKLFRAAASFERVDAVLNTETSHQAYGDKDLHEFRESIVIKDLNFAYVKKPILSNINIEIHKGEFIIFSGLSGAGKTTLIRNLVGLLTPQKGLILIDNIDIKDLNLESFQSLFSYVPQTTTLFNMSIRHNIAYGRPEATDDEIFHVSRLSCAHDFIKNLPNGYDTHVGEMGEQISAGQRQRIAIARALLVDAAIIVFDECFSDLDYITERSIYENLMTYHTRKTIILITHRLSTVRDADRIYHLVDGCIAESGTHEELMKLDGEYKNLYLMQERLNNLMKTEENWIHALPPSAI